MCSHFVLCLAARQGAKFNVRRDLNSLLSLSGRRGAQRTYEVTEVNEMLQGMERYNGIFICTTNLLESLDQTALRRFTFNILFLPLTSAQREVMFIAEELADCEERHPNS